MKTLVIVAHPELADSGTQQFLRVSQDDLEAVTWHPLTPAKQFDVAAEQQLLMQHDRIILQFPLYWYSAPAILKQWEDDVLTRVFTYPEENGMLSNKQLGLVVTLGVAERQYHPGQLEHYNLDELLRPYQALAHRAQMQYLTPFIVDQFAYMTSEQKTALITKYRAYLAAEHFSSLAGRNQFITAQMNCLSTEDQHYQMMLKLIIDQMNDNQRQLSNLKEQLQLIKRQEES